MINTGTVTLSVPGRYTDNQFTANWDRDFNHGKDRLSERFFWSDSETYEPFGADNLQVQTGYPALASNLNFPLDIPLRGRFGSIAETHSFSNALINEFRFGVNVISDSLQNVPVPGASPSATWASTTDQVRRTCTGSSSAAACRLDRSPTSCNRLYRTPLSGSIRSVGRKGHHSLRFGGEIDRTSIRRNLPVLDNGLLYFEPGSVTGLNYFQNFLLGAETFGEGGGGAANHDYHIPAYAAFAQDDWRITPTLTLNLGLRTEWVGAAYDNLCHLGNASSRERQSRPAMPFVYPSCVSKFGIPGFTRYAEQCRPE